ncbi:MAG: alkaline phosphatase [Bacteroidales bacterium]|nr:alkaline phosphatase [Bacteroidales bacterium]
MIRRGFIKAAFAVSMAFSLSLTAGADTPKYVFYLIGDGMGINEVYSAQLYNRATGYGPENLNFFHFPVRTFVTTYSASSLVTDSAAAGTALATGVKTYNDAMGVDADTVAVSSIADWAKSAGFGVGVITSVGINHATPAAFYAHAASRAEYEKIAGQLAASKVDFAAGGGVINEVRKTGHDSKFLEDMISAAGVSILRGEQLKTAASHTERVLCLSENPHITDLPYAIDRTEGQTGLPDFVRAGIEYLSANFLEKGFFCMIEGGSIDHAGHSDDGASDFWEINDFAEAIDLVLAFYHEHPDETLIVVTADHETGACAPGAGRYEMHPELLAAQKCSEDKLNEYFREFAKVGENNSLPSWEEARSFFTKHLGLWDVINVDPATEAALKSAYENAVRKNRGDDVVSLYSVSTRVVSDAIDYANRQAGYLWPHGTHTGSPVGLYVKGVNEQEFLGCTDNTDIPKTIARIANYSK